LYTAGSIVRTEIIAAIEGLPFAQPGNTVDQRSHMAARGDLTQGIPVDLNYRSRWALTLGPVRFRLNPDRHENHLAGVD
jgi:hypothetical protein